MNLINAAGWTLLHFLWQGALIAGAMGVALALLRRSGARVRYAVGCAAMLLMLVCAVGTFFELRLSGTLPGYSASQVAIPAFAAEIHSPKIYSFDGSAPSQIVAAWLPVLVWAWLAGVSALSIRSVGGWAVAERFARRRTSRADAVWEERLAALAKRLRISSPVKLAVSALAEVPAVVGWLRPIVLVPTSIFTGLTAEQIDALLAHELAHVRRHDYLINLMQTAAETLFFYHPAVWWVNRKIREERENCCDDLAVEVCGSTLAYVRALTDLEQMRRSTPRLAMAADGGSLLHRVQRLLRVKQSGGFRPSGWTAGIGIAVAVLVTGIAANGLAQRPESSAPVIPTPSAVTPADLQNTDDVLQSADEVRQQTETVLKSVDAAVQNIDAERQKSDVERQTEIEQALTVLQRQMALIRQQSGGVDTQSGVERMRAVLAQLEALSQQQNSGAALQSGELQRRRVELAQLESAIQQQVAQVEQRNAAQQQPGWLAEIQAEGYRNLTVDQLIRLKEHGVTGEYIQQIRAAGQELSADELVRFREHGVTPEFINEVKQTGFKDVKSNDLIRLREHGADAAWIRQIQSGGYPEVSLNDVIRLREHGVTPEFIRDARNRFKNLSLNQLLRLKEAGVF